MGIKNRISSNYNHIISMHLLANFRKGLCLTYPHLSLKLVLEAQTALVSQYTVPADARLRWRESIHVSSVWVLGFNDSRPLSTV